MTLSEIQLQNSYDSGASGSDILQDFYVPVLQEAVSYKRLTGYFSSQVLALAARGIAGLIQNGGSMKLITSPSLSQKDFEVLIASRDSDVEDFVTSEFERALKDINDLSSVIAYDHLRALGWMLRERHLEIRVLVPRNISAGYGIFHSKVGIVTDSEGNKLSFSGSVNETAMGWTQNIEEFKVFKSWTPGNEEWIAHDELLFDKYWECSQDSGFEAIALPKAAAQKLIDIAPNEFEELKLDSPYKRDRKVKKRVRTYQKEAIKAWIDSGYQGILEMATGTGKTFTARECIDFWKAGKESSVILVIAPTQTIGAQWREVLSDLEPITTFEAKPWRELLQNATSQLSMGVRKHIVVISIQNTASSDDFIDKFSFLISKSDNHLLIADEMHGLGAPVFRKALNPTFEARLGLSATPNRWFDEDGTLLLTEYFKEVVYTFGIHEALHWIDPETNMTPLCPYEYYPRFVDLVDSEIDEYLDLTRRIIIESSREADAQSKDKLEQLLFKRAAILKTAVGKYSAFEEVVDSLSDVNGCLVYCSDRDQINQVIDIVARKGILYRTFTGEEGTTPKPEFDGLSERDWILASFEAGNIQMLIAMKCLDEGVDIPSAKIGIILASTTNPREFIQRRGRLLRRALGKEKAIIYDMVVAPIFANNSNTEVATAARKILSKELERIEEFSKDALNSQQISGKVLSRMLEMGSSK